MSIMCDEIIFHHTPKNLLSNYLVIVEQRSCRENSIKTKENSRIYIVMINMAKNFHFSY